MKKAFSVFIAMMLLCIPATPEPQVSAPACPNGVCTMTGSAIRLVPTPANSPPLQCNSMLIEVLSGTGTVYVLNASPGITMTYNTPGTVTVAALGYGSSGLPLSFTFPSNSSGTTQAGGFDLRNWGVYDATSGDTILATCDAR